MEDKDGAVDKLTLSRKGAGNLSFKRCLGESYRWTVSCKSIWRAKVVPKPCTGQ